MTGPGMCVEVRLAEPFWRTAGVRRLTLELGDGSRVADVLAALGARYPALGRELAEDPPLVFVGDDEARAETRLAAGSTVHLVWPVAGG